MKRINEAPALPSPIPKWQGSTTVVYTVVWRNPVVWWGGWNTALWLVRIRVSLYVPSVYYQAMGSFPANHSAVFHPPHQTTGFRQTTVDFFKSSSLTVSQGNDIKYIVSLFSTNLFRGF